MKAPLFLLLALIPVRPQTIGEEAMIDDLDLEWFNYQTTYNKTYATKDETTKRRRIWEKNLAEIVQHNKEAAAGKHSYTLGVNAFTDMTPKEFMTIFTHPMPTKPLTENSTGDLDPDFEESQLGLDLDDGNNDYFNWRRYGAVSPVKDQVEVCKLKPGGRFLAKVRRFKTYLGEKMLHSVVRYKGPASVSFLLTNKFIHYKSGIFIDGLCHLSDESHAMLVVGYTKDYWIVKNSFGTHWGEDGYIRVQRGFKETGMCNIAADINIPEMS